MKIPFKIIYILCLLIGAFLSYVVFRTLLVKFADVSLPFPDAFNKSVLIAVSIVFILPIISFLIHKLGEGTLNKSIKYIFLSAWIASLFLIIHSVLSK
jgi:pilus assembly protein TadC